MAGILNGAEVLVVEDETLLRKRLGAYLESRGASVTAARDYAEAENALADLGFDFALVDIHLPDGEGLDLLKRNRFSPNTGVVIMTAEGGVESAVEAMRLGAGDYLAKPFDPDELPIAFSRCRRHQTDARLADLEKRRQAEEDDAFFFGPSLEPVKIQLERILSADRRLTERLPPVLIEGETGTGKTTIARWLHRNGPRADQSLVELNCSTLPENLAESELFGHERGAFTDARSARIGLFEAADGGTLFLDEIPSLSPAIQAKVLTAIEDGRIRRLGGSKEIPINVRLIAATNREMRELVAEGLFREDLYHRLDLLRVRMPPLRERGEDVARLAEHLGAALAKRYRVKPPQVGKPGAARLREYAWPGNVRELAHEIERAIVMGEGEELTFAHLAGGAGRGEGPLSGPAEPTDDPGQWLNPAWSIPGEGFQIEEAIDQLIEVALEAEEGNVSAAARRLGVPRDYVRYRLKKR